MYKVKGVPGLFPLLTNFFLFPSSLDATLGYKDDDHQCSGFVKRTIRGKQSQIEYGKENTGITTLLSPIVTPVQVIVSEKKWIQIYKYSNRH